MKCPNCNGVPYDEVWTCEVCNGTGIVEPLTNEEWFCSLSTEGKAEVIAQLSSYGGNVEAILLWLKQPHKE